MITPGQDAQKWALVLPHRERLIRLARSKGLSAPDAEDCAHDAMIRVVAIEQLDPATVSGLLSTITKRLAVDLHRLRTSQGAALRRLHARRDVAAPPDERVCDESQARHARRLMAGLRERERDVLELRVAGLSTAEAAARLGVTHKSAESSLTRARGRLLKRVMVWTGLAHLLEGRLTTRSSPAWAASGAAVVAVATIGAVLVHPQLGEAHTPPTQPAVVVADVREPRAKSAMRVHDAPDRSVRPAPTSAPARMVRTRAVTTRPVPRTSVGPVEWQGIRVDHWPFAPTESLERCISGGVVISAEHIGCRPPG